MGKKVGGGRVESFGILCKVRQGQTSMKAICNSCLRVGVFASYEAAHKADCQCGATAEEADSFCACPSCQGAIKALEKGHRNGAAVPGMFEEWKTDSWTAEGGAA